jgi:hypothetical protein
MDYDNDYNAGGYRGRQAQGGMGRGTGGAFGGAAGGGTGAGTWGSYGGGGAYGGSSAFRGSNAGGFEPGRYFRGNGIGSANRYSPY